LRRKKLKNWLKFNRDIIFLLNFERFQHPYIVTPRGKPVVFEMRAMPNKDENVKIYIMNIKINLKDQET